MHADPAAERFLALCDAVAPYDAASFAAGRHYGTRVAACVARLAAIELMADARWWNHWRRRLMARALVAHAEEMEISADADQAAGARAGGVVP
jgi:hypothetical protein